MKKIFFSLLCCFSIQQVSYAQGSDMNSKLNDLLNAKSAEPFNGIVLLAQNGEVKYAKNFGFANKEQNIDLTLNNQFVIGSISKQITAALVMQEVEKGHVKLDAPISKYLYEEIDQNWADSVTVRQLLNHTHGITAMNKPLAFRPGTQFAYSQLGYVLLAKIIENTSEKPFSILDSVLFTRCDMRHTVDPSTQKAKRLATGYTQQKDGSLTVEKNTLENPVPAGGFISTANDLLLWNDYFFGGKLLSGNSMKQIYSKQLNATREHPIFGLTDYGLGLTVDTKDNILQYGQTGFSPGFASMNFYFPETKTSLIILSNVAYHPEDLKKTFAYHTAILKLVRESSFVLRNYK